MRAYFWRTGGGVIQNLLYYSVTRHENMENMVSVMLCVFFLLGGGVNLVRDIFWGVLVNEMQINMDKLITCI